MKDISNLPFLKWNYTGALPYTTPTNFVALVPHCNGFTVVNTGNTIVWVDDQILYPGTIGTTLGDSISVGGNYGELLQHGQIKLRFGAGATPQVLINQKYYIL